MNKEQLYDLFQQILSVKKFEHQLLYNAMQLDSSDEQAAAIRRELDARREKTAEMERNRKLMPKFVLKDMEGLFIEEMNIAVSTLRNNLESLPVQQGGKSENSTLTRKMRWINTPRSQSSLSKGEEGD